MGFLVLILFELSGFFCIWFWTDEDYLGFWIGFLIWVREQLSFQKPARNPSNSGLLLIPLFLWSILVFIYLGFCSDCSRWSCGRKYTWPRLKGTTIDFFETNHDSAMKQPQACNLVLNYEMMKFVIYFMISDFVLHGFCFPLFDFDLKGLVFSRHCSSFFLRLRTGLLD